jgi:hypothetical protein
VDHPDRKLVTNQNLGHIFNPSSVLSRGTGRTEHYVLADLFAWLAAYSGLSQLILLLLLLPIWEQIQIY